MRPGRPTQKRPHLTLPDRVALQTILRATAPASLGHQRRARLILLIADGASVKHAAKAVSLSRECAYRWLKRWATEGVAGLLDRRLDRRALTTMRR